MMLEAVVRERSTPPRSRRAPDAPPRPVRQRVVVALLAAAMSILFGLPHVLIPWFNGPERAYTPFAVDGVSALTFDKTVTYAAQLNYMVLHIAWPYDTDVYEYRDVPAPVPTVPYVPIAGLALALGGVDGAFIAADFILPPVAFVVLYLLLFELSREPAIAVVGSLATLLVSFGPRNLLEVPVALARRQTDMLVQPLEYSRFLHPELSFTLLALGLLLLWRALQSGHYSEAIAAGVIGGLQFYTYVYYWPVWIGACALLLVASLRVADRRMRAAVGVANVTTWLVSLPFWLSFLQNHTAPAYVNMISRHADDTGRIPTPEKVMYTLVCIALFGALSSLYISVRGPAFNWIVLVFLSAVFCSAIGALNMELVTGFNLESMLHYPNRVFQPFFSIALFVLAAPAVWQYVTAPTARTTLACLGAALLVGLATVRQTVVARNVAPRHVLPDEPRQLFDWLNAHTTSDDVVLAQQRQLNELLPVLTRDRPFVPSGDRTGASYDEIMRRFLVGMKLLQVSPGDVRQLLAEDHDHAAPPIGLTYTYDLFTGGHGIVDWRLPDASIASALQEYEALDLSYELGQQRLDFVYTAGMSQPAQVSGWRIERMYTDAYGSVWHVSPASTKS